MTLKQQYQKERHRIQQFISRAKKRGFTFQENVLPVRPKKITTASINRLKNITPKKLYQKATYESTQGKVSGAKGRQIERTAAVKKAAKTRKQKEARKKQVAIELFPSDYVSRETPPVSSGEIALQTIESMIQDAYNMGNTNSADLINRILNEEIQKAEQVAVNENVENPHQTARNRVGFSIENAPRDAVEAANVVFKYKMYTGTWQRAYTELINIITGTIATSEESRVYQDIMNKDIQWNDENEGY